MHCAAYNVDFSGNSHFESDVEEALKSNLKQSTQDIFVGTYYNVLINAILSSKGESAVVQLTSGLATA